MSMRALEQRATSGDSCAGGRPTSGRPSTRVDARRSGRRPRRAAARCRSGRRARAARGRAASISVVRLVARTRRSRARRRAARRSRRARSGAPSTREVLEVRRGARFGLRVDEADEVDAVLGMLEHLAGDELADVAGADDDRVLAGRERCAGPSPARRRGRTDDERDRDSPEARRASAGRGLAVRVAQSPKRRATFRPSRVEDADASRRSSCGRRSSSSWS